jgi:small-conductance mechanosensitive channel
LIDASMLVQVADVLHREFFHNSLQAWLSAALTAAVALFVTLVARRLLVTRLGAISARTSNYLDSMVVEVIAETRTWVLVGFALLVGVSELVWPARVEPYVSRAGKLVFLWQAAVWGMAAITFWVKHHLERRQSAQDRSSIAMIGAMGIGAKVLLWVLIFLTALRSVFNVEVTAWIAGLGVSGIAVALAVQNILGDLLAALAIVLDKPFDLGDSIGVDGISGTVEHIGLKTTRIRSVSGEQIIIGNGDLLKSRIRNYRRMYQRRVAFPLDVTFDTPPDVLATLPGIVEQIISAQRPVRFDRCHVSTFTDSAIRLEAVYYVLDPDYKIYMDIQQAINMELLRRFAAANVEFAFPSRTVYHQGLESLAEQATSHLPQSNTE